MVSDRHPRRVNGWWAYWFLTTLACTACATVVDALLLQRKFNYFTGGFLARDYAATWSERFGFLASSLATDFAVLSVVVTVALWLALMARLRPRLAVLVATVACLVPLAIVEFANYRLAEYLGDSFDLRLMFDLSGRSLSEFLAVSPHGTVDVLWAGAAGAVVAIWVGWTVARELAKHIWARTVGFVNPHAVRALIASCSLVATASTAVIVVRGASESMDNGLKRKPTVQALSYMISVLTDVDRDGYGLLGRISDTAPFDARIHPYAVDIPGNGIDEDGVGGDFPRDFPIHQDPALSTGPWKNRPNLLLVLLESVRDDMVGSKLDGRPVTPVLDRLTVAGARSTAAYSHNGFTVQSRRHLFSGSLTGLPGGTTLIDDFKGQGYQVAYFSGQDDSFGGVDGDTGMSRADIAYDARSDRERRYSVSTTPGSLAVPLDVVLERVQQFLASRRSDQPLFMYVNLHDTHYPYHHDSIQQILPAPVLRQTEIVPGRADDLRRMYANSLANVDRAIGRLLTMTTETLGEEPGVIVTSDHGESLFEEGTLGHGYQLDEAQTRVPLIVTGIPMRIAQPWSQSVLRGELVEALAASNADPGHSGPVIRHEQPGEVFQYLGTVDAPAEIGLRGDAGQILYDFRNRRIQEDGGTWVRPDELPPARYERFLHLIRTWEGLMLARDRAVPR